MFKQTDNGRSQSRRPGQRNDCTVRAYAEITGEPYDSVYDKFHLAGRICGRGFSLGDYLKSDKRFIWHPLQAIKGEKRITPQKFAMLMPIGKFILRTAGHVFAMVDSEIRDTQANYDRCVYGYWEFKMEGE